MHSFAKTRLALTLLCLGKAISGCGAVGAYGIGRRAGVVNCQVRGCQALWQSRCQQLFSFALHMANALRSVSRKAINVGPTVIAKPSGAPYAPLLNLGATEATHAHTGPCSPAIRSDIVPSWVGSSRSSSGLLLSKTYINGAL